jgi:hypothetical protein
MEIAVARGHTQQCFHQRTLKSSVFAVLTVPPSCWNQQSLTFQQRNDLGQKILIPLCVLSSKNSTPKLAFGTLRTRYRSSMNAQEILYEQQLMILMASNVREWTHVLFVNTPCFDLLSFCSTGVSNGLATWVTSRGRLRVCYFECTCFWLHFCTAVHACCWVQL